MVGALEALRQATASRHEQLDGGLPLAHEGAGLPEYALHLQLLRDWMAPLNAWLERFDDGPQGVAGLAPVERMALLQADLLEPGMLLRAPFKVAPWPEQASAAYRWGVVYVLEGAQLGGAVLYQRLAARLAPHPLRYLRGDPAGPGPRWRMFMLALKEHVTSEDEIADACTGACAAFDRILALHALG
ncbi:biliverdin-producing heme oxygenase [Massilia sp. S19_KUP03_FR1]|uniref:biliverdin-producing heme oxygenase n=1 Tax=Massilia sp. S19_KUP03_FR1 TaxID=3025503 RepID=UPI002FCDABD3